MQGLEIARTFFLEWGLPWLKTKYPQLVDRVAAGRFSGSDVLCGDDAISRDHNWGPQFHLFLTAEDYAAHGTELSRQMNDAAPKPWKSWRVAGAGDNNAIVESVPAYFERVFGLKQMPPALVAWDRLEESKLYFLRHGAIWHDPAGELTAARTALHSYPGPVLRRRLQEECFRAWHFGEYNFVQRMIVRNDPLTIAICLGDFCQAVMRLLFLIEGDYTPYWKWLAFEFRKRPVAVDYAPLLMRLVQSGDRTEQAGMVRQICTQLHTRLLREKLVTGAKANQWLLPLLNDANELANPADIT